MKATAATAIKKILINNRQMGCPTSIYYNSDYESLDGYKGYTMYWENVDYTISLGVVETYSNYEEYDVVLDYFSAYDFTYYSKTIRRKKYTKKTERRFSHLSTQA